MKISLERRDELLERIVDELLVSGVGDLSLRPLADRVGTSARLLIYHFQSKEQLIAAALAEARRRIEASLSERAAMVLPQSPRALLVMFWDWATEETNQRYFRLLFEVEGLAMFDRIYFSEEAHRADSASWAVLIERAAAKMPDQGDRFSSHSTLITCALSGLLHELLTTGDLEKTTSALATLIEFISGDDGGPNQDRRNK